MKIEVVRDDLEMRERQAGKNAEDRGQREPGDQAWGKPHGE